tara:strand:+ start:1053 stop:1841 length:789 start_codon:yes stop_codon:yes gene_type:complete
MANTPEYFRGPAANFVDENIGIVQGAVIQAANTAAVIQPNSLITDDLAVKFRQAGEGVFARMAGFENPGQGGVRRGDIGDLGRDIGKLMIQNADMMAYGSAALGALKKQAIDNSDAIGALTAIGGLLGAEKNLPAIAAAAMPDIPGMPDVSDLKENLARMGSHPDSIAQIMRILDLDGDGKVSTAELESGAADSAIMDKLTSIDANTAKMIKDPDFRRRVIPRVEIPSIYGEDPSKQYNQVQLVEQGLAGSNLASNQFNVAF